MTVPACDALNGLRLRSEPYRATNSQVILLAGWPLAGPGLRMAHALSALQLEQGGHERGRDSFH